MTAKIIYVKLIPVIMNKIAIIGDGGWGTALALLLNSKGLSIVLWSHSADNVKSMKSHNENMKFLKGVSLPPEMSITTKAKDLEECSLAVFAVPCRYMRAVAGSLSQQVDFDTLISATKGIEHESLKRPSEVLGDFFPESNVGVLSGPSIAYEVARQYPTTIVLAMESGADDIRDMFMTDFFRVYTSTDLIGVEIAGALKNIIAIAAGISDGLGYGTNSKSAILTRGLVEITRLGVELGAKKATFSGLSGLGDLATTCISEHSRNRWFGERLVSGENIKDIINGTDMVVEGYFTAKSAYKLFREVGVSMPIAENIYQILYEGKEPERSVRELMIRQAKEEDYS